MSIKSRSRPAIHYVTFGQSHHHTIEGQDYGPGCVATYMALNATQGRAIAFALFNKQFCFEYHGTEFDTDSLNFFSEGFKAVPQFFVEKLPEFADAE